LTPLPPPKSTLFPYTTLFRSHTGENFSLKDVKDAIEVMFSNEAITFDDFQRISNEVVTESFFYKPTVQKMMNQNPEMKKAYEQLDRKSTRLNSSHVSISYAVF